jgi:hypothetical protein
MTDLNVCPPCWEASNTPGVEHPGGDDIYVGKGQLSDHDLLSCDCLCHPATKAQYDELMKEKKASITTIVLEEE